jgi:hypothetical protein
MTTESLYKLTHHKKNQDPVFTKRFLKICENLKITQKALDFIALGSPLSESGTVLYDGQTELIGHLLSSGSVKTFIDTDLNNKRKNLNAHFSYVNDRLDEAGIFIGCATTIVERKVKVREVVGRLFFKLVWSLDFIINRAAPKLSYTKSFYKFFTGGRHVVISKAELLGRLVYCGFEIIGYESINGKCYYSVMKTGKARVGQKPSFGLLFKMNRISKNSKIIGVYKIRTMHAYSEFLQDYVVKLNGYNKTGKPDQDFRLTSWGRIVRRLHLDELPQLLNVLKGELNLVGVRPLSEFGFHALPLSLREERIKYRAGCIPPNVALGITGFAGIICAERIYLRSLRKGIFRTNFRFFWMAIFNILSRKIRSA